MNLPFEYERLAIGDFGGAASATVDFDARARRHPSRSARSDHVVPRWHAQRAARDSRRLLASGDVGRGDRHRRARRRHLHAPGDGAPVRDDGRSHAGNPAGRRRAGGARKVPGRARRRAFDYGADCRGCGSEAPGTVGAAARRSRRPARLVHGNAVQPRVRDAPRAGVRTVHAGWHPQPLDRRGGHGAHAGDRPSSTTSTCAGTRTGSTAWSTRSAKRCTSRSIVDALRSGDHAGGGNARTGRPDLVRDAGAVAARDRARDGSSAATSSSCVRCPATSRRTSSARS